MYELVILSRPFCYGYDVDMIQYFFYIVQAVGRYRISLPVITNYKVATNIFYIFQFVKEWKSSKRSTRGWINYLRMLLEYVVHSLTVVYANQKLVLHYAILLKCPGTSPDIYYAIFVFISTFFDILHYYIREYVTIFLM